MRNPTPILLVFFFCFLGQESPLFGQCNAISFSFEHYQPCHFRVSYSNTTECYSEIVLELAQGEFLNPQIDAPAGFILEQLSPSQLSITHSGGFLPMGSQDPLNFELPYDLITEVSVSYNYYCPPGIGCILFPSPVLESCPDPQNAIIIGTVYRECGFLPYTNQTGIPDWTVELLDETGNLLQQAQTDAAGQYNFYDLPVGNYTVQALSQSGWTPKVPISGEYQLALDASEQQTRNFGECPDCSCDSIFTYIHQEFTESDTSCYLVYNYNSDGFCFPYLDVVVDTGQLVGWSDVQVDWLAEQIDNQTLRLTPPGGYFPAGLLQVVKVLVAGSGNQTLHTTTEVMGMVCPSALENSYSYVSPPAPMDTSCCQSGATQGPELVLNGEFSNPAPAFGYLSGHSYFAPGNPAPGDGFYSILNSTGVSAANGGNWFCLGKDGTTTDNFMVVDGSTTANTIVWRSPGVPVTPNTTYAFCIYARNIVRSPGLTNATLQLFTNFNQHLITQQVVNYGPGWQRISGLWTTGSNQPATTDLVILNSTTTSLGNDFAIDCISFRECIPGPCEAEFAVNFLDPCGQVELVAQPSGGVPPYSYQWTGGMTTPNLNLQLACGNYTYCLTITDSQDCTSTICHTFTVSDVVPPNAVCAPGIGVDLDGNCQAQLSASLIDGGSTDNCQIQSMSVAPSVLTGCGVTTVTLTVTDWCGNSSTCTTSIQTLEVIPPVVVCPPNISVQGIVNPAGNCESPVTGIAPLSATDNCALLGVGHTIGNGSLILIPDASGTVFSQGSTTVTYYASDQCQNTGSCSFTVTVECPDCQCPSGSEGPELITNGEFDNTGGFASGYTNQCSGQIEGQYCLTNNAANANSGFSACTDPTGSGNIFVANGAVTPNSDVLCYGFASLKPNTNYVFSFYHSAVTGANPAQLAVFIDGVQTGLIAQVLPVPCMWNKYCLVWNTGPKTSATVCIRNLNTQQQGNDFAIDKVSFRACTNCAPLPNGAVLWMPMDEIGGEAGLQSIVGGLFGISATGPVGLNGPIPIPGKVDANNSGLGGLAFLSPGNVHAAVNSQSLNFGSGPFTIDAWVSSGMGTQTAPIVEKMDATGGYAFSLSGNSGAAYPTLVLETTFGQEVLQGPPITVGAWNFVAAVVNPPTVTIYTGGDPGGSSTFTSITHTLNGTPIASSSNPMRIAYNPLNPHWQVDIDELELFNTALSTNEVQAIWTANADGKCRSNCQCGGFSKLFVRNKKNTLNLPVSCSGPPITLPCEVGQGYQLAGVFHCDGGECVPDHTINWTLTGPNGGTQSGSFTDNDPFFSINLLPLWFAQPGAYTLALTGDCGQQTCSCEINLLVDCPDLCPCETVDIIAFQQNVNAGFAMALALNSCSVCFSPMALSDCETVTWYLNSTGGTNLGSTTGKQTFCHTFSNPGTYTVVMYVERLLANGGLCAVSEYSRTITVNCMYEPDCPGSVYANPRFSENPMAGTLGEDGNAPGWTSQLETWGDPHENIGKGRLLEDGDSDDGWVVLVTGSYFGANLLQSDSAYCISKSDSGMISLTLRMPTDPIPGADVKVGRKPPGGNINIALTTGSAADWPLCEDGSCYTLASLEGILPLEDGDWYSLQIPFNLSDWTTLDSCSDGEIPARLVVFVGNVLGDEQLSAGPVQAGLLIDDICFRDMIVPTQLVHAAQQLRVYPNPSSGVLTLTWDGPPLADGSVELSGLLGQTLYHWTIPSGSNQLDLQPGPLPPGMYYIKVWSGGKLVASRKIVRQ